MKEVTYEDWQKNPTPRMMWVWDDDERNKVQAKVVVVTKTDTLRYSVLSIKEDAVLSIKDDIGYAAFHHCAEIEEPKKRRMTKQELSWWLQDGIREGKHREWKYKGCSFIYHSQDYHENEQEESVSGNILIRENGGEWREPLVADHYKD